MMMIRALPDDQRRAFVETLKTARRLNAEIDALRACMEALGRLNLGQPGTIDPIQANAAVPAWYRNAPDPTQTGKRQPFPFMTLFREEHKSKVRTKKLREK